jgi:hypothetical protein
VLSRIAVPLPNGMGSGILLTALFGSVALTTFAIVSAISAMRKRREEEPLA